MRSEFLTTRREFYSTIEQERQQFIGSIVLEQVDLLKKAEAAHIDRKTAIYDRMDFARSQLSGEQHKLAELLQEDGQMNTVSKQAIASQSGFCHINTYTSFLNILRIGNPR